MKKENLELANRYVERIENIDKHIAKVKKSLSSDELEMKIEFKTDRSWDSFELWETMMPINIQILLGGYLARLERRKKLLENKLNAL